MDALPATADGILPGDVPTLQRLVRQLLTEVQKLRQENEQLRHRLDQALRPHFGRRSERSQRRQARVPRGTGEEEAA